MIQITPTVILNDRDLTYEYIRSAGPGGQNVNKVSTGVQLRFHVETSDSLSEDARHRLIKLAGSRMAKSGELVIEAKRYRTQEQNRLDAEERLRALVQKALVNPKKRHPTRPGTTVIRRRMEAKKSQSAAKRSRQKKVNIEEF